MHIIGYTADADSRCPDCARKAYPGKFSGCGLPAELQDPGWHHCGQLDAEGSPCHVVALDHEGNEVYPIFSTDECQDDYCNVCGIKIE